MNKVLSIFIFIVSNGFIFLSCKKENEVSLPLVGCCNNDPVYDTFGNASIYIPNIFTPNDDGVNDEFYPLGNSIKEIIDFEIKDQFGLTVFHVKNLTKDYSWDGKVRGKVRNGLYNFTISVEALNGSIGEYSGTVCNYVCGLYTSEPASIDNCAFSGSWNCWLWNDGCLYLEPCFP